MNTSPQSHSTQNHSAVLNQILTVQTICANSRNPIMMAQQLTSTLAEHDHVDHVLMFIADSSTDHQLIFAGGAAGLSPASQKHLSDFTVNFFNADDDLIEQLLQGEAITPDHEALTDTRLATLSSIPELSEMCILPILADGTPLGLLVIGSPEPFEGNQPLIDTFKIITQTIGHFLQITLKNQRDINQLSSQVNQLNILQQIDEELNDTIKLDTVFSRIMDWALRFSNATSAALVLYNDTTHQLTIAAQYGYNVYRFEMERLIYESGGGITKQVARTGEAIIIPDVRQAPNYLQLNSETRSQMSLPIYREHQVIAVLTLESTKVNAFTEDHQLFCERLAQRAGVAVDNARLFAETNRERKKLSHILRNIGDIVMLLSPGGEITMINHAALVALHLGDETDVIGQRLVDILEDHHLSAFIYRALQGEEVSSAELELPNGRTYVAKIEPHLGVGWVVVMQDVTSYVETDKLKNELVSTVSHDLKQPLAVMRGYLDLLRMTNEFDSRSSRYVEGINYAIENMRQLIDDILDLARIESGVSLDPQPFNLTDLLTRCISHIQPNAEQKEITIDTEFSAESLTISGDVNRLNQVFNNLVGNAVKYTPNGGHVRVALEEAPDFIEVIVQDSGIGMNENDLEHIFERFYRVRNASTEGIEGTGLGLAIVKSLVEAHDGQITVTSKVGEGSIFRVMLPAS